MEMSDEGYILWPSEGATDMDYRGDRLGHAASQGRGDLHNLPLVSI